MLRFPKRNSRFEGGGRDKKAETNAGTVCIRMRLWAYMMRPVIQKKQPVLVFFQNAAGPGFNGHVSLFRGKFVIVQMKIRPRSSAWKEGSSSEEGMDTKICRFLRKKRYHPPFSTA